MATIRSFVGQRPSAVDYHLAVDSRPSVGILGLAELSYFDPFPQKETSYLLERVPFGPGEGNCHHTGYVRHPGSIVCPPSDERH